MDISERLPWFEMAASVATVGALVAVIFWIRKSRKIDSREIVFETQKNLECIMY